MMKALSILVAVGLFGVCLRAQDEDELLKEIEKELATDEEREGKEISARSPFGQLFGLEGWVFEKQLFLSCRYSDLLKRYEGRNGVGFELFRRLAGSGGDVGEFDLQAFLVRYDNQFMRGSRMRRFWTDGEDDWELEIHNAFLKLRILPPQLNIWIGHFDVPFGLEPYVDTHLQLLSMPNSTIGFRKDWGVALGGQHRSIEYRLALSRGSGMEFSDNDGNYLLALKISTARVGEKTREWTGFSVAYGAVVDPLAVMRSVRFIPEYFPGDIVKKFRAGIDFQKVLGRLTARGELSWGQDSESEDVLTLFAEFGIVADTKGHIRIVFQSESFVQDFDKQNREEYSVIRIGLIYKVSLNLNIQLVWSHDFDTIVGRSDDVVSLAVAVTAGGGLLSW